MNDPGGARIALMSVVVSAEQRMSSGVISEHSAFSKKLSALLIDAAGTLWGSPIPGTSPWKFSGQIEASQ